MEAISIIFYVLAGICLLNIICLPLNSKISRKKNLTFNYYFAIPLPLIITFVLLFKHKKPKNNIRSLYYFLCKKVRLFHEDSMWEDANRLKDSLKNSLINKDVSIDDLVELKSLLDVHVESFQVLMNRSAILATVVISIYTSVVALMIGKIDGTLSGSAVTFFDSFFLFAVLLTGYLILWIAKHYYMAHYRDKLILNTIDNFVKSFQMVNQNKVKKRYYPNHLRIHR